MPWLDLEAGIVEEFAGAQSRHVNATADTSRFLANRRAHIRERKSMRAALHPAREAERKRAWYARAKVDPTVRARRAVAAAAWRARNPDYEKARKRAQWQRLAARWKQLVARREGRA